MASVLARTSDGRWRPVEALGTVSAADAAELWHGDVSPLFELPFPAWVLAHKPDLPGTPDALCVTQHGDVIAVVAIGEEPADLVRARLLDALRAFDDRSFVEVAACCNRIGTDHTPGTFIVDAAGSGDAVAIDRAIAARVAEGAITVVVAALAGYETVAAPLLEAQHISGAELHCFDLLPIGVGDVRMIETWEVSATELEEAAAQSAHKASAQILLDRTAERLGERRRPLAHMLQLYAESFFAQLAYLSIGEEIVLRAWLDTDGEQPSLEVDSAGRVIVGLERLKPWARKSFHDELSGLVDGELDAPTSMPASIRLSFATHLDDPSLVEQFIGVLSDTLLESMGEELSRAS